MTLLDDYGWEQRGYAHSSEREPWRADEYYLKQRGAFGSK